MREGGQLAELLKRHRMSLGLTQEALALRAGMSTRGVSDLERSIHPRARRSTLERLASALELDAAERARLYAISDAAGAPAVIPPALREQSERLFVGRVPELQMFEDAWRAVTSGATRFVIVDGLPGIGKSTLARVAALRCHDLGALVLTGTCDDERAEPYHALREALRRVGSPLPIDHAGWSDRELAALGVALPGLGPDERTPDADQLAVLEAARRFVGEVAHQQPVVLLLDDLQWADAATLAVLRHLGRTPPGRVLVLATARFQEAPPRLDTWLVDLRRAGAQLDVIGLEGLSVTDIEALVRATAGFAPEGLAAAIERETAGNAFFAVELLADLRSADAIRDGRWRNALQPGFTAGTATNALVRSWLARLSEPARSTLQHAAVVGPGFDPEFVAAISERMVEDVRHALDEARKLGLVVEAEDGPSAWRFVHGIVRSVLYDSLGVNERARLHARAGHVLAAGATRDDDVVERLAFHYLRALRIPGVAARAREFGMESAQRAASVLAWDDASQQLERTLEADLSVSPEPTVERVELLLLLGQALTEALQRHRARPMFLHAATLAMVVERPDLAARAAAGYSYMTKQGVAEPDAVATWQSVLDRLPDDMTIRAPVEAALATAARLEGDRALMHASAQASLRSANESADLSARRIALANLSLALWDSPELDTRMDLAAQLQSIAHAHHDVDLELDALGLLVLPLAAGGRTSDLDDVIRRVERMGIEHQRRISIAQSHQWQAMRALMRGEFEIARSRADAALEISGAPPNFALGHAAFQHAMLRLVEPDLPVDPLLDELARADPTMTVWRAAAAAGHCTAGTPELARPLLETLGDDWAATAARDWSWLITVALLAEVAVTLEAHDAVPRLLANLDPYAGQLVIVASGVSCEGAVDRYRGLLRASQGDVNTARAELTRAAALEEAADAPALAARTRDDLQALAL